MRSFALSICLALVLISPSSADAVSLEGEAPPTTAPVETDLAALEKASQLAPDDAGAQKSYVQALLRKGRVSRNKATKKQAFLKASEAAAALVEKDASYDNLILKVSAELGAGLLPQAVETATQATSSPSSGWVAHFYLGLAHSGQRQYQEAVGPLVTAQDLVSSPEDRKRVWRQLGFVYEKQKMYTEAIRAYQQAGDGRGVERVRINEATVGLDHPSEWVDWSEEALQKEEEELEEAIRVLQEGGGER